MKSPQTISASVALAVLEDTLDGLDADVHAAFIMHEVERLPLDEVADALGKTRLEVEGFVKQAREFLLDCLDTAQCDTSEATVEEILQYARETSSFSEEEVEAAFSRIFDKLGSKTAPEVSLSSVPPATRGPVRDRLPDFARLLPAGYFGLGLGVGIILHALLSPPTPAPEPSASKPRVEVRTVVVHDVPPTTAPSPVPASPNVGHDVPRTVGARIVRTRCAGVRATVPPAVVVLASNRVQPPTAPDAGVPPPAVEPDRANPDSIEAALIDEATTAYNQGDATAALGALSRHRERFPQSVHAENREYLTILALSLLHDDTATRQRAREFLDRYPTSFHVRQVSQILGAVRSAAVSHEY